MRTYAPPVLPFLNWLLTLSILVPGHFAPHLIAQALLCTLRELVPGQLNHVWCTCTSGNLERNLTLPQSYNEPRPDQAFRAAPAQRSISFS